MQYRRSNRWRLAFGAVAAIAGAATAAPLGAQDAGSDLRGVVIDVETREGIADVILRVLGTDVTAATDDAGEFTLRDVPGGTWTLRVEHLRYGTHEHEIAVSDGMGAHLEIRLDEEAIELEPVVVEAESSASRGRRAQGASFWEVTREEIARALGTSRHMGDLIRQTVPGLKLRQANNLSQTDICLEFRAAASISIVNARACNHPAVYLDGVPVSNPQNLYGSVGLHNLERIQVIPPGDAGARYGTGALYGVLLIETQRPGRRSATGTDAPYLEPAARAPMTFDWDQDPAGHNTGRTILGAVVGNAVGLGAGLLLARQCIGIDMDSEIATSCSGGVNVAAGLSALVLPAVGSAVGARIGGGTDLSVGRLAPALLGAGMMLFPGYAFAMSSVGGDVETINLVGQSFLAIGVPLAVTMADRLFRTLR